MRKGVNHAKVRQAITQMNCQRWEGVWVAGGVGRSFFNNDPYKDVDMYFDSFLKKAEWVGHMLELGAEITVPGAQLKYKGFYYDHSIELYAPDRQTIIDHADFTVNAIVFSPDMSCTHVESHLEDVYNRELRVHRGFTPLNSVERAFKLIKLGYKPSDDVRFWAEVHEMIKERA